MENFICCAFDNVNKLKTENNSAHCKISKKGVKYVQS